MKAELNEYGRITLEPETEHEKNFIEYWGTNKYIIEPKISFSMEERVIIYLSEKMPDRGVTMEAVTEWVEARKAAEKLKAEKEAEKEAQEKKVEEHVEEIEE